MTVQDLIDELTSLPSTARMLPIFITRNDENGDYDIVEIHDNSHVAGSPAVEIVIGVD